MDQSCRRCKLKHGKLLGILLAILIASILIGISLWDRVKIGEPIYFRYLVEHYLPTISDSAVATSTMQLMYVQDFTDKRELAEVEFIDHPELKVTVISREATDYIVYKVIDATLFLAWDSEAVPSLPEVAEVNWIQVTYSDGSSQKIDIGRICIYGGESDERNLEAVGGIPLWESERLQTYQAKDSLIIDGLAQLSKEFLEMTDLIEAYSFEVDGNEVTEFPIEVKADQEIEFRMSLNGFDANRFIDANSEYDYFQMVPQLRYHKESGETYTTDIHNYPVMIWFRNFKEVRNYAKERRLNQ